jgi:hypothetical protein
MEAAGRGVAEAVGRAARGTAREDAGTSREASTGPFDIAGRGTAEATGRATVGRARQAVAGHHHHAGLFDVAAHEFFDVDRRIGFFDVAIGFHRCGTGAIQSTHTSKNTEND